MQDERAGPVDFYQVFHIFTPEGVKLKKYLHGAKSTFFSTDEKFGFIRFFSKNQIAGASRN